MTEVKLILGDALDVLREMEPGSVDAVICDPPYPGLKGGLSHMVGGVAPRTQPTVTVGTPWGNELEVLREFRRVARCGAIVFCSWHSIGRVRDLLGGEPVGLITWYKRNSQLSFRNRPHYTCEYAWLIEYGPGMNWRGIETHYDIPGLPAGCFASERITDGTGKAAHPTQKPLKLMRALCRSVEPGALILDPFLGSGTTAVAAILEGRRAIGIEIDEGYFKIAQKRTEEASLQMRLDFPIAEEVRHEQPHLL